MPLPSTLLRRSLRPLLLGALLLLIWAVVLPYQAAVRIDQSLANWVQAQPGLQLIRSGQSPFFRDYQIHWRAPSGHTALILTLRLHTAPPAFSRGVWVWGTLMLALDPRSPWQIQQWNRAPLSLIGTVSGLGQWQFMASAAPAASDHLTATRTPGSGDWQLSGNWPGLILQHEAHALWLGRSQFLLRQYTSAAGRDLDGSVHIRRLGWRLTEMRGQLDQLDLWLDNTHPAGENTLSGAFGLMARHIRLSTEPNEPPGAFRASGQWQAVGSTFPGDLWQLLRALDDARSPEPASIAAHRAPRSVTDALDDLLLSIGQGTARINTADWETPAGRWQLSGEIAPITSPGAQLSAQLSAQGDARAWLIARHVLPEPAGSSHSWHIQYHPPHWQIHATPPATAGDTPDAHALPTD